MLSQGLTAAPGPAALDPLPSRRASRAAGRPPSAAPELSCFPQRHAASRDVAQGTGAPGPDAEPLRGSALPVFKFCEEPARS